MPYKDPEKRREYYRKRCAENREYKRKWDAENPEKNREYKRKWYAENREKIREYDRKWHAENPEKKREYDRKWRAENPEKRREYNRKWHAENPEKRREYDRKGTTNWSPERYAATLAHQKGACYVCGRLMKIPQADHDHVTGQTRALLCARCNAVMHAFDDPHLFAACLCYRNFFLAGLDPIKAVLQDGAL